MMGLRRVGVGLAVRLSVPGQGGGPPTSGAHTAVLGRPGEGAWARGRARESQEQVEFEGSLGGWWEEPCAKARYPDCAPRKAGSPCTRVWTPTGESIGFFRRTDQVRARACEPEGRLLVFISDSALKRWR